MISAASLLVKAEGDALHPAAKRTVPGSQVYIPLIAAASGCALALVVVWLIANRLILEDHDSDGIVSFTSIHQYPKARDVLLFYLALILLPVVTASFWWVATRFKWQSDSHRDAVFAPGDAKPTRSWREWDGKFLILVSFFFYMLFLGRHHFGFGLKHDIDMFHEGALLSPLESFLRGDVPFRDFFLPRGLIENLIEPWVAIKLFGASVASVRILNHLIAPLPYVAAFLLGTQLFETKLGAVSVPTLMFIRGDEISDRYLAALLALALVAAAIRREATWSKKKILLLATMAGALTALQILWSLELGLYILAATVFVLGAKSVRRSAASFRSRTFLLLGYGLGVVGGAVPFTWYLVSKRAIGGFLVNCLVQTRYQLSVWGIPYPPLFRDLATILRSGQPPLEDLRYLAAWYIPVVLYLALGCGLAVAWVSRRFEDRDYLLLLMWLAGAFAFRTALGRSDDFHLKFSLPFFWIVICLLAERLPIDSLQEWSGRDLGARALAAASSFVVVFAIPVLVIPAEPSPVILAAPRAAARAGGSPRLLALSRAGRIRVTPEQAQQIVSVVSFLQAVVPAGEAIFDFSNQGAYYFLADRPSATKYAQIAYVGPRWMQLEVINDLERVRPRVVIFQNLWKDKAWADSIDGIDKRQRYYLVADYLQSHFSKHVTVGETILLLRTPVRTKNSESDEKHGDLFWSHRGKTPTSSGSSARSGASVWTTSSCSMGGICAGFFRPTSITTTVPELIYP